MADSLHKHTTDNMSGKVTDDAKNSESSNVLANHAQELFEKRQRACVKDNDGYIVCGPIVGYERAGDKLESIFKKNENENNTVDENPPADGAKKSKEHFPKKPIIEGKPFPLPLPLNENELLKKKE